MSTHNPLLPVDPQDLATLSAQEISARLKRYSELYEKAMRPATVRAVKGDWKMYATWCATQQVAPLAIHVDALAAFLNNAVDRGLRRATLDRYLFTIRLAHRAADLADPTLHREWKLLWRGVTNRLAQDGRNRRRPARPLSQADVVTTLGSMTAELRDLRDAALLCLASDSMARREELARVRVNLLTQAGEGGRLEIPWSKTDKSGEGRYRHISPATWQHLRRWLTAAGITRGPVFRAVHLIKGSDPKEYKVGDRAIAPQEIARIFKRRLKRAALDGTRISGHSTRVGSTHDLLDRGYSAAAIALAGGWEKQDMVIYYAREKAAETSAMADARRREPLPSPSDVMPDDEGGATLPSTHASPDVS